MFTTQNWYENWENKILTLKHLQKLSSLTFQCEMVAFQSDNLEGDLLDDVVNDNFTPNPICSTVSPISGTYMWSIDDPVTISKMCAAPNVHGFSSPIFEMHGFKWYITVYPNGSKTNRKGKVNVSLILASVPSTEMKVMVRQRLYFRHRFIEHLTTFDAEHNSFRGYPYGEEYTTEEMKAMKFLCFTAEIEIIEVKGAPVKEAVVDEIADSAAANSDSVSDLADYDNHKSLQRYQWTINSDKLLAVLAEEEDEWKECFSFFGLQWSLSIDKLGTVSLSLVQMEITDYTICVRFTVSLLELGTRFIRSGYFDSKRLTKDWGGSRVAPVQFLEMEQLTVQLKMEMIDMHQ